MFSTSSPEAQQHSVDSLRALLNIQKRPLTLSLLLKEYREMEGKHLPFRSYGFKSAEDYLKATGQFLIINDRGEVYISARPNKNSAHIVDMVSRSNPRSNRRRSRRSSGFLNNRMPTKSDDSWNKSSYSSNVYRNLPVKSHGNFGNGRRDYDKSNRNNQSVNQRLSGDSNNNTTTSNNRNIIDGTRRTSDGTTKTVNGRSTAQPQPLMNISVPKPDLRERLYLNRQQINQEPQTGKIQQGNQQQSQKQNDQPQQPQNSYKQQQPQKPNQQQPQTPNQQQAQKSNQQEPPKQSEQNSSNNKTIVKNSNEIQNKNGQQNNSPRRNEQRQEKEQKTSGVQSKPIGVSANRLENIRNTKNLSLNTEKTDDIVTFNTLTNKNIQTPTTMVNRIVFSSIQDRLKVNKPQPASENEINSPLITPQTSPLNENFEKSRSLLNSSRQSSQDLLHNYMNSGKPAVINKPTYKTKKILLPTEKFEFDPKLNSVISIMNYCSARGYPEPQFNLLQPKFIHKKIVCSLTINGKTYTTIPKYFDDPHIAKAACAAIAIQEIKENESMITSYAICTDSPSDLLLKIYQELKDNHASNGIFLNGLPKLFESRFHQTLPNHWYSLVENSKLFVLEKMLDGNTILYAHLNIDETNALPIEKEELIIDPLELPWDRKFWNLYITHCASTVEVWARIVDKEYSQQLDSLLNDIDLEMLTDKARPGSLTTGQMYLVCISECWHRVRLERMDKATGKCLCFFIDFGDDDWLPMDQIFICDKKFLKLPPQAVSFSLFGLEDFEENPVANSHLNETIMGKTLIAQIFTRKETYEAQHSTTSSSSFGGSSEDLNEILSIQAVLYDTSSDIDIVLNPLLINKICDDTPVPKLKQSSPTNVNITHVTENGDIYLQVLESGLHYVQKLISQLVESKFQEDQYKINAADIKSSKLYLIHDEDDNKWYRGCLAENSTENPRAKEFKIFYVDYGFTRQINVSNIFRLESLSAALSRYPRQGLKAKMYNLPLLNEFVLSRLKALLPSDSVAIVKLAFNKLDPSRNVIPQIIVFIRSEGNKSLCNVNDAIRIEYELISNDFPTESYKITSNNEANVSPTCSLPSSPQPKTKTFPGFRSLSVRSPITVPSTPVKGSMQKLSTQISLPDKGEIFNVLVTIASNPFNFFVRPYSDFLQFQNLMTELQNNCQDNDEFIPDDMVEVGEAYAVLLDDGFYYRCIIERILPDQMCVVYFCDCGDRNVVNVIKLRTLPAKCRELPVQAIQARLHGVKPSAGKWTLEDSFRFSELTVGQRFASVVENISIDDFDPNKVSKVLELTLIDVLTSEDIYIHDILIEENRAFKC